MEARRRFDKTFQVYDQAHEKFVSLRKSSKFDVAAVIEESLNQQCTQRNCANENNVGILSRLLSSQYHGVVPDEKSVARHTVNLLTSTIKMYTLQAENALDQMDWMEKINGVIASLLSVQTLGVKIFNKYWIIYWNVCYHSKEEGSIKISRLHNC
ncbi:hypothetical protein P8452_29522 [Trifolium repens]|nr:hypothetical protein P8452_29522 [Trifolium repens]